MLRYPRHPLYSALPKEYLSCSIWHAILSKAKIRGSDSFILELHVVGDDKMSQHSFQLVSSEEPPRTCKTLSESILIEYLLARTRHVCRAQKLHNPDWLQPTTAINRTVTHRNEDKGLHTNWCLTLSPSEALISENRNPSKTSGLG